MSRTNRREYRKAGELRHNHRTCSYCREGRLHTHKKREQIAQEKIEEWETPDQWWGEEEDFHIELEKCLDHEAERNMIDHYVNQIDQWELDETPESQLEEYLYLVGLEDS